MKGQFILITYIPIKVTNPIKLTTYVYRCLGYLITFSLIITWTFNFPVPFLILTGTQVLFISMPQFKFCFKWDLVLILGFMTLNVWSQFLDNYCTHSKKQVNTYPTYWGGGGWVRVFVSESEEHQKPEIWDRTTPMGYTKLRQCHLGLS